MVSIQVAEQQASDKGLSYTNRHTGKQTLTHTHTCLCCVHVHKCVPHCVHRQKGIQNWALSTRQQVYSRAVVSRGRVGLSDSLLRHLACLHSDTNKLFRSLQKKNTVCNTQYIGTLYESLANAYVCVCVSHRSFHGQGCPGARGHRPYTAAAPPCKSAHICSTDPI